MDRKYDEALARRARELDELDELHGADAAAADEHTIDEPPTGEHTIDEPTVTEAALVAAAAEATADADLEELPNGLVLPRRRFLKLGAAAAGVAAAAVAVDAAAPTLRSRGLWSPDGALDATSIAWSALLYTEAFPTSPLILSPFSDPLPIPQPLKPVAWDECQQWDVPPGPWENAQSSYGGSHQIWPTTRGMPLPKVYHIQIKVAEHAFTTSKVLPITSGGKNAVSYDSTGKSYRAGTERYLPKSTIYGFNGTFPGPMINAEYGQPNLVRFENLLHINDDNLPRMDFGAPDASFLTHLHNAHTAPESDGNPFYTMRQSGHHGYEPGTYCDNLYLNWPAGNDEREKQSFFWFHDHRMDHTGANVYKGMVGLYPIYDPVKDFGDERYGLRLPGKRVDDTAAGTFSVDYDVPLAFYDCRLDDGNTIHQDIHDGMGDYPDAGNPRKHPEWWGKTFFKHFPNHGFVGDIFTVNGTAYPVMEVAQRKYRFRFLDASVARIYEFKLMSSTQGPKAAKSLGYTGNDLQGQYRLTDAQQCMKFTQIASDGGLLPFPITRDSFELWPAKRREMIIDFTTYMDGSKTTPGDVVYLCNVMKMPDGRMWSNSSRFSPDPKYIVPVMKFVIGQPVEDNSILPTEITPLRELPPLPSNWRDMVKDRMIFEVQRGSAGGETEWLINGQAFDPTTPVTSLKNPNGRTPLAQQKMGSFNVWEIRNGGGGWVHPFHLHMEEHRTVMRNGVDVSAKAQPGHPEDKSREDLVALDPGESVMVYRGFRDFTGPYVAHCHNLAHEDHAMMFGWEITP